MKSLNQIKKILTDYFHSHAQVEGVYYCDKYDFNSTPNKEYPAVNIDWSYDSNDIRTLTHNYNIQLVDLMDEDIDGIEDEIFSDMSMIAEDFFTFLQFHPDFNFNPRFQIDKVIDETTDRVAGVKFRIGLTVTRSLNTCSIPTIGYNTVSK